MTATASDNTVQDVWSEADCVNSLQTSLCCCVWSATMVLYKNLVMTQCVPNSAVRTHWYVYINSHFTVTVMYGSLLILLSFQIFATMSGVVELMASKCLHCHQGMSNQHWTEHAKQTPMYGSSFLPQILAQSLPMSPHFSWDLQKIWCRLLSFSDQLLKAPHITYTTTNNVDHKKSACPLLVWNCVHLLQIHASTAIYCCIKLLQLLSRWQH